jgi:hypothetical protein
MHPVKAVSTAMASPIFIRFARTFRVFMGASQAGYAAVMRPPDVNSLFCLNFIFDRIRL